MREHLLQYNQQIKDMITLKKDDYVLDNGSNGSTFCKIFILIVIIQFNILIYLDYNFI